ncbi:hypothetical protein [Saccharothrix sp. HUAS TT1]|uniref:hypothetical protein n=1 Tax=unclassified Saccharothrix TaxID=2593673 RepID=UPI00345B85C1
MVTSKYEYVKRISLVPREPLSRPRVPEVMCDYVEWDSVRIDWDRAISSGKEVMSIQEIDTRDWQIVLETDHPEELKKLVAVVGWEKAEELYEALTKPTPQNWDKDTDE